MATILCRMKDRFDSDRTVETEVSTVAADLYVNEYVIMNEGDISYIEVLMRVSEDQPLNNAIISDNWELWRVECIDTGAYITVRINEEQYHQEISILRAYAHGKQN